SALNSMKQEKEVIDAIIEADLITTSVGVSNFSSIAKILAKGIVQRVSFTFSNYLFNEPFDIIANENTINASSTLKQEIAKHVSNSEMEVITSLVGFPNTAVDRVALTKESVEEEFVSVEPAYEWVINKSEMANLDLPAIECASYVEYLKPFIERKLFIVNMGHATTAYIGFLLGQSTIQEALKKEIIEQFLRGTLLEASQYFIKKLNIDPKVMKDYLAKTIKR